MEDEVKFGQCESVINEYVPCLLTEPKHPRDLPIYELFVRAGRKSNTPEAHKHYWCWSWTVSSKGGGRYGFYYSPGKVEGELWEVPQWAIALAGSIRQTIKDAEDIGRESGYSQGLAGGKAFVRRLAEGSMGVNDFEKADGRDSIRLHRKEW